MYSPQLQSLYLFKPHNFTNSFNFNAIWATFSYFCNISKNCSWQFSRPKLIPGLLCTFGILHSFIIIDWTLVLILPSDCFRFCFACLNKTPGQKIYFLQTHFKYQMAPRPKYYVYRCDARQIEIKQIQTNCWICFLRKYTNLLTRGGQGYISEWYLFNVSDWNICQIYKWLLKSFKEHK